MTTLEREDGRRHIRVGGEFAAKTATDFGRCYPHIRDRDVEQFGHLIANGKSALRAGPDLHMIIFTPERSRGMGLDIPLMHHRRLELAFHNHIGRRKALGQITAGMLEVGRYVGRFVRFFAQLIGKEILMQQRRVRLHGFFGIEHDRQHLIFDFDQGGGFFGNVGADCGHRSHRMTVVKHLVMGDNVIAQFAQIGRIFPHFLDLIGHFAQIGACTNRRHARQFFSGARVDRENAGMGMGAAHKFAIEHVGQVNIVGIHSTSGHLIHTIVADGAGADYFVAIGAIGCTTHQFGLLKLNKISLRQCTSKQSIACGFTI